MRRFLVFCIVILVMMGVPQAGVLTGFDWFERKVLDKFEFLPEFHLSAEGKYFFNHKNDFYKRRFFLEWNNDLELALFDYRQTIYSIWYLDVRTGLGRQSELVIFDPRDSRYGIIPSWEVRLKRINVQAGLSHFCFHDIDRIDDVTEYWNMPYLSVFSKNYRLSEYRQGLVSDGKWDLPSRFSYMAQLSKYSKNVFGIFPEEIVSGGHDYDWEVSTELRYAFYKRLSWIFDVRTWSNLNITRGGDLLQTYSLGLESHFRRGKNGMMLFGNYNLLDELRVRPKDKLLEIGFRFYM